MTRGNRIVSTLMFLGLLAPSLSLAARSQSTTPPENARKTFTISGVVGLPGVTLTGLPGDVKTGEDGTYSCRLPQDWKGRIVPVKVGYAFEPPFRAYDFIDADYTGQDFTAKVITFTISGSVGLIGVEMQGLPGQPVTDARGNYRAQVQYGWSGTVRPVMPGYEFDPRERLYTKVAANMTNENYRARTVTFTISGQAGAPGVLMRGLPGDPVADQEGNYRAVVPYGWTGDVIPEKAGHVFKPARREYGSVRTNRTDENYAAEPHMVTISNVIKSGAEPIQDVAVTADPGGFTATTDSRGRYSLKVPYGWSGRLSMSKPGFAFEGQIKYQNVTADAIDGKSVPAPEGRPQFTISGNAGVPGVALRGLPGRPVSDSQGYYSVEVERGWAGGVVPYKEGYVFTPQARQYNAVTIDQDNQDFAAEVRMIPISDVVTVGGEPIAEVKVTANPGDYTATTDSRGRYTIQVPYGWSGGLSMSKPGFSIDSSAIWYRNVMSPIMDGRRAPSPADMRERMRSRLPSRMAPSPTGDVLVVPRAEVVPERLAETTEDLRVMLQILHEKLNEPRMILGVLRDYGSFFGDDRKGEALYLQGTAAVFVIKMDFPYSFPAQQPAEDETRQEAADPVWQRARQKLYSPDGAGNSSPSGQTPTMTFEQFKEELLQSLRHAANLRHIDANELVILTLVARNEDPGRTAEADMIEQYANVYGSDYMAVMGMGRPAPSTTVLTMQARKADIDAFAEGTLDFDQFRRKVRSFTY